MVSCHVFDLVIENSKLDRVNRLFVITKTDDTIVNPVDSRNRYSKPDGMYVLDL